MAIFPFLLLFLPVPLLVSQVRIGGNEEERRRRLPSSLLRQQQNRLKKPSFVVRPTSQWVIVCLSDAAAALALRLPKLPRTKFDRVASPSVRPSVRPSASEVATVAAASVSLSLLARSGSANLWRSAVSHNFLPPAGRAVGLSAAATETRGGWAGSVTHYLVKLGWHRQVSYGDGA